MYYTSQSGALKLSDHTFCRQNKDVLVYVWEENVRAGTKSWWILKRLPCELRKAKENSINMIILKFNFKSIARLTFNSIYPSFPLYSAEKWPLPSKTT